MDMDSDSDSSVTSKSTTSSSECPSVPDEERLEPALILGATVELPQDLCEHPATFNEFFSLNTWNCLSEANKQHLRNFLPSFPDNDEEEKEISLRMLFAREPFKFSSPLVDFQRNLHEGNYRPDIAKMRDIFKKTRRKEQRFEERERCSKLMKDVLLSRHKLLDLAFNSPPGAPLKAERSPLSISKPVPTPSALRAKKRYFQELANIGTEVGTAGIISEDENYPEGPPAQMSRKQRRHLSGIQGGAASPGAEMRVQSTLCHRDSTLDYLVGPGGSAPLNEESYRAVLVGHKKRRMEEDDHPELETGGITLSDISVRTQLASGHRRPIPTRPSSRQAQNTDPKPKKSSKAIKTEPVPKSITPIQKTFTDMSDIKPSSNAVRGTVMNSQFPSMLQQHGYSTNTDSENDSVVDPVEPPVKPVKKVKTVTKRAQSAASQKPSKSAKANKQNSDINALSLKAPIVHSKGENFTISHDSSPIIPQKAIETEKSIKHSHFSNATVATYSDLEGIDMMHLPVDLDDSNIDILDEMNNKTPELMQETHACFLSLIRDIIYSTTDHRMHMDSLEKHLVAWQDNPISPLNDWYNLVENWLDHLPSAINFLTGDFTDQPEDFVPYLEYKPMLQMYQWIGAGRDTDNLIVPLCHYWFDHKSNMAASQSQPVADTDAGLAEQHQIPPLPRWPTTWKVRKVEDDEIQQFREQERIRYEAPHKAFTYRMHGFESVVAPIKGIYNQAQGISKARGHLMLNANRPNFVTILTLVRDATARLPNGEGTRADIVELLRCSQYISTEALDSELQSVVSGALDRMHTEYDPCVKYDPKRKIWIYLHRNRTESEFERVHQQIQAMGKLKRSNRKPSKPKAIKSAKAPKSSAVETTPVISDPELALDVKEELEINVETDPVPPLKIVVGEKLKKTVKASVQDKPVKAPKPSPVHVEVPVSKVQESLPLPAKPILPVKVPNNTIVSGKPHTSVLANQGTRAQSPVVPKKNIVQNVDPVKMSNLAVQKSTEPNLNDSVSAVISTAQNVQNITVQRQVMTNASMSPKTIKPIISMPSVVASTKPGKSLVKITPGKSLINPAVIANAAQSQQVFIKQQKSAAAGEQILKPLVSQTNVVQQQVTMQNVIAKPKLIQTLQNQQSKQVTTLTPAQKQQLLQSLLAQQQKQQLLHSLAQQKVQTTSVPVPQLKSQQLIQNISQQHAQHTTTSHVQQTFTPQQILQSIANTQQKIQISAGQTVLPIQTTTAMSPQQVLHTLAQQSHKTGIIQATSSGQTTTLTHAQQQQLLQSLKQQQLKNQQQSMAGAQFQLKQHAVLQQLQKQIQQNSGNLTKTGTSLLGTNMQRTSVAGATQTPLVAKVLTNASGQVISVESLLNKQGIQQGVPTTLRVGPKPGQSNMIQLSSGSPNQVSQYAVVSQGNIIQVSSSRVMSAHTSTPTLQTTPISAQRIMRPVVATKPNQKLVQQQLTQQIVNAKLLQGKIIASQPNKSGIVMANLKNTAGGNALRMVNTSGLNIAHIGGKPIILASKGSQLQGQNVILQGSQSENSTSVMIGGQALKVPNNLLTQGNVNLINANLNQNSNSQTVVLGGQMIKVQSSQSGVSLTHASSSMNMGNQGLKTVTGTNNVALNQQSVVLGQALKVQSGTTVKTQGQQGQRVVLASQGQGGQLVTQQILLPPGFQGGSINIKTLQGLKVIPIAQQGKGGLAGRQQVFARLISPPSPRPPLQGE